MTDTEAMQVMDQAREMVELRPDGKKAFSFCGGLFICFAAVLSAAYVVLSSMSAYLTIGHVLRAVGLVAIVLLFVSCYGIIFWSVIRRVTWCLSEDGIEMQKSGDDSSFVTWGEVERVMYRAHGISVHIGGSDAREETVCFVSAENCEKFEKLWWEKRKKGGWSA